MKHPSINEPSFWENLARLLRSEGEALVLFRYRAAAGSKDFLFVDSLESFRLAVKNLPAHTNVVVFGDHRLPLRGKVDAELIRLAQERIPNGSEFLVLCMERTINDYRPHHYWESFDDSSGESHEELVEALNQFQGKEVAIGLWPPWPEQSGNSFEVYVPDETGRIISGPY